MNNKFLWMFCIKYCKLFPTLGRILICIFNRFCRTSLWRILVIWQEWLGCLWLCFLVALWGRWFFMKIVIGYHWIPKFTRFSFWNNSLVCVLHMLFSLPLPRSSTYTMLLKNCFAVQCWYYARISYNKVKFEGPWSIKY